MAKSAAKASSLFRAIEKLQGDGPWGHILDAGTGARSLSWIAELPSTRWTAVTAQPSLAREAREAVAPSLREHDRVLVGNWVDDTLLADERFDTVILDYFIGAIDAFAPYAQENLLRHMAERTRGTLYVIGLEPYVPVLTNDEVGGFIGDLGRLRDACMLLARERPYREYPAAWVGMQLQGLGLSVTHAKHYPIRYRQRFLDSQLEVCRSRLERFSDPGLAQAMGEHIEAIRERGLMLIEKHDGLLFGKDYVIRCVWDRVS